ncbi:hypothetical protein AM493_02040 [Flavobacterium akiainvivens]|uniref:Uncharacterized protein n=1 Tax=Flavobacterium akiainvivens TaxID=1202724 RepID=A0A0M9VGX7_9FLAO|nr:hypothetical protein [Flavobacterium akiainvivens]KOS04952.1 hypothetical protein AM493_02040 [Flavobacterium akiainvivens]SFQ41574.1 hypothetical protein SAMN05444144_104112 [Flavobacterium akiainvivens]
MVKNKQTRFIYGGLLLAAAFLLFVLSGNDKLIGTYGVNRTIGWASHAGHLLPFAVYGFIFVAFVCSYLAMYAFGVRFIKWLVIVNAVSFLGVLPLYLSRGGFGSYLVYLVFGCLAVAFLSFFANIIVSLIKYSKAGRNIDYQK